MLINLASGHTSACKGNVCKLQFFHYANNNNELIDPRQNCGCCKNSVNFILDLLNNSFDQFMQDFDGK